MEFHHVSIACNFVAQGTTTTPASKGGKLSSTNCLRLKLYFGPYSSPKSQNMWDLIFHKFGSIYPLSNDFYNWLIHYNTLSHVPNRFPFDAVLIVAHIPVWWCCELFCYNFWKFHPWLPTLSEWPWGLGSSSLPAWVGMDNWIDGHAAFWMGGYVWFQSHRISQSHIRMPLPFTRPFKHPIETLWLIISHHPIVFILSCLIIWHSCVHKHNSNMFTNTAVSTPQCCKNPIQN